jgi:NAD(P)-dependent dehydrogenase (short-subunit alcohol dehydrogenase family)
MKDFKDKVVVVTGGASGIGLAMAERFARDGAKIVLGDIEQSALDKAIASLKARGTQAIGVQTDVTHYEALVELERKAVEAFGKVHILCNNAGVGALEDLPLWELPLNDWRWTFAVNVWGVIHGIKAFVPGMIAHGEHGHVINTSSGNGGLIVLPNTPIYATSKSAVSTITEALHYQLTSVGSKIHVSVLYPGPNIVASNIFSAARNRPAELAREIPQVMPPITLDMIKQMAEAGGKKLATTEPAEVAEHVIEGLRTHKYFILPPSPDGDRRVRERTDAILARETPKPPALF